MSTDTVVRNNIEAFAERFLNLEKQKKTINDDIKALKEEFNQEGVPTQVVVKCINAIKKLKKKTDSEIFEEETIQEWLQASQSISDSISDVISKS